MLETQPTHTTLHRLATTNRLHRAYINDAAQTIDVLAGTLTSFVDHTTKVVSEIEFDIKNLSHYVQRQNKLLQDIEAITAWLMEQYTEGQERLES